MYIEWFSRIFTSIMGGGGGMDKITGTPKQII